MATWDRLTHYYSGQGVVLIGEYDNDGIVTGLTPVGNVTDLRITVEVSKTEHKESQSGQRAVDYEFPTETKAGLTLTLENYSRDILAMALRGGYTDVSSGEVVVGTPETIKFYKGKVVGLEHIDVNTVVIKKATDVLVPYTDSTTPYDYKLNAKAGSVMFADTPATFGLTDGDALTVSYKYGEQAVVDALTKNAAPRYLRFEGLNTVDGDNPVVVEAFRFVIDPAKELALITSEEMASFEMEGAILSDSSQVSGSKFFRQRLLR